MVRSGPEPIPVHVCKNEDELWVRPGLSNKSCITVSGKSTDGALYDVQGRIVCTLWEAGTWIVMKCLLMGISLLDFLFPNPYSDA